jgi:LmbE family N-acetylglucosaminyl deacetylase
MNSTAVISPHPDDAVLSCWLTLTAPGEVTVINLFTGLPVHGSPVSWWDGLTGATDPTLRMSERLAEDRRALALAGRQSVNLDFVDDQYRDGTQPLEGIVEELRARLTPGATVLAPAGIGGHPDHLLARSAALRLHHSGHQLALYAELPHAICHGWPQEVHGGSRDARLSTADVDWQQALAEIRPTPARAAVRTLCLLQRRDKLDAVRVYRTQIQALNAMAYQPLHTREALRYEVTWELP